ncbi:amino acid ABC transporter permease [Aestuariimicrobium soli]|uniref:amino acid ABC transporter permease n=1 Tax=Aestuariimicrobium soli TaxID=2035834 RepID=UPI003EBDB530
MSSSLLERARQERPSDLKAAPVRHPWRWVLIAVIAVLVAMMVHSFATNPKWEWSYVFSVMNYRPILQGLAVGTLLGTLIAMIVGVSLGVVLAVMRLSSNPVLSAVAAVYTWFFRSVPRYVLLTILGVGVIYLYPHLDLGLPFGQELSRALGLDENTLSPWMIDTRQLSQGIVVGAIGLGLSEAAYMSEIARAGILSVDTGQREAAAALGMSSSRTMSRIVLPQAMRVIVPPTGNETIAMVKDTSLLIAVPVGLELFNQASIVANRTYKIMPAYVAATLWYIIICSVLMVGQTLLERHFGRGFGAINPRAQRLLNKAGEH